MQTKICKTCGKELPIDEFQKSKQSTDGHLNSCKKCRGAFQNTPDVIKCPVCGETKPYYDFYVAPRSVTGRMWACKHCIDSKPSEMSDQVYRRKYDSEYKDKINSAKRDEFSRHINRYMLTRAKQRAERNGLEFNLELEDIVIPDICPLLEVPIVLGTKEDYEYSPSLDRIDNTKGYVKGNVWVISKKANSMKNSASPQELSNFCKNIIRYSLNTAEMEGSESEDKEPQR